MYATYARKEASDLLIRVGHRTKKIVTALRRAERLQAHEIEVRAEHLPRAKSLVAIRFKGVWVSHVRP